MVVTAPGQIAHEFIDTGANAQPGTGRYTRSHSTGLDVFNNIGETGQQRTCRSALHTDTDRPASVAAAHNGTNGNGATSGNLRGPRGVFLLPFPSRGRLAAAVRRTPLSHGRARQQQQLWFPAVSPIRVVVGPAATVITRSCHVRGCPPITPTPSSSRPRRRRLAVRWGSTRTRSKRWLIRDS